jgi:hypothetical protein
MAKSVVMHATSLRGVAGVDDEGEEEDEEEEPNKAAAGVLNQDEASMDVTAGPAPVGPIHSPSPSSSSSPPAAALVVSVSGVGLSSSTPPRVVVVSASSAADASAADASAATELDPPSTTEEEKDDDDDDDDVGAPPSTTAAWGEEEEREREEEVTVANPAGAEKAKAAPPLSPVGLLNLVASEGGSGRIYVVPFASSSSWWVNARSNRSARLSARKSPVFPEKVLTAAMEASEGDLVFNSKGSMDKVARARSSRTSARTSDTIQ